MSWISQIVKGFFVHIFFPLVVNFFFLFFNINNLESIPSSLGNILIFGAAVWLIIGIGFLLASLKNSLVASRRRENDVIGFVLESPPPSFRRDAQRDFFKGFIFLFSIEKEQQSIYSFSTMNEPDVLIDYLEGPYCPHDETYLESEETFLAKSKYVCDECGFSKKVKEGPITLKRKARNVFDSRLEKYKREG